MDPNKLYPRDSFSSCPDVDIFVIIQYPKTKFKAVAVESSSIDTIEIQKMEKTLGSMPVYFLVKTSKLFVITFLFPFHLFLVRIPSFFVKKILPKVVFYNQKIFSKVFESFSKVIHAISTKLKVLASLNDLLKPFSKIVNSLFHNLSQNFLSPFRKLNKLVKKGSNFISKKIVNLAAVFQKIQNFITKSLELAKKSESLKRSTSIKNNLLKTVNKLNFKIQPCIVSIKNKVNHYLNKIQKNASTLSKKTTNLGSAISKRINQLLKPAVDIVKNKSKQIAHVLNRISQKIAENISSKLEIVQARIEKTIQIVKPSIMAALAVVQNLNGRALQLFFNISGLQAIKSQAVVYKRIVNKISNVQIALLKSFERTRKELVANFKKYKEKAKSLLDIPKKKIKESINSLFTALSRFMNSLKYFLKVMFHCLKKFFRFFVSVYKWFRIMAKFTVYLIREIFREVLKAEFQGR